MKAKDDELVAAEPVSGIPDRVLAQIKDIQVLSQNKYCELLFFIS